jgi:hypothetical protein
MRKKCAPAKNRKNLEGERYGRLLVLNETKTIGKFVYWLCLCECGESKYIRANNLMTGTVNSCGCLKIENRKKLVSEQRRME